jgi:hypothetical protein
MNVGEPTGGRDAIVARASNIILRPKEEWPAIDVEPSDIGGIMRSYVTILAAIPALARLIGSLAFGFSMFGITYRPSIVSALGGAVTQYVLALIGTYVLALIIDALAPTFDGTRSRTQAFKIAAYSSTAAWLAGVFAIIPALSWLSIVGLYSLYLFYLGLPLLMRVPAAKATSYTAAVIVAAIVLFVVIGAITTSIGRVFVGTPAETGQLSGTLAVPGVGTVDLGKIEAASKQAEAAANRMQAATAGAAAGAASGAMVPAAALQALLPATLGAYRRTELSSSSANAGGLGGTQVEGKYENGANAFRLNVTDIAAAGAIAALGSAFNVQSSHQTATGYDKTETIDGRMTTEKWDSGSKNGSYSVLVANRFMVAAEGTVGDIAELKQAVAAIPADQLEALAKK